MLIVAIAKTLTSYIPMMTVPTFEIGEAVIDEIKAICPEEHYCLVGGGSSERTEGIQSYTNWSWKFQSK